MRRMYVLRVGDSVRHLDSGRVSWLAVGACMVALAGWVTLVIGLWRLL